MPSSLDSGHVLEGTRKIASITLKPVRAVLPLCVTLTVLCVAWTVLYVALTVLCVAVTVLYFGVGETARCHQTPTASERRGNNSMLLHWKWLKLRL